jgi:hypothetical protein
VIRRNTQGKEELQGEKKKNPLSCQKNAELWSNKVKKIKKNKNKK